MIFKPEMVEKILAGQKTETRRPVKGKRCPYKPGGGPGGTYAIQPGRGKPAIPEARLKVVEVWRERLGQMNDAKAWCEGFAAAWTFMSYWRRMYPNAKDGDMVWVIRFELVDGRT